ncbi:MAG TPA: type VI secretion system baseplate subunit TssE [Polyangiaceae bacterium]|nr:type VI secretion system baseplate subunit TssE [Polyangiaceae bacterium]
MAELTPKERLQPSLLDRLTDDNPEKAQESRDRRVLSPQRLRESVRRDLTWLFNSTSLASAQELDGNALLEGSTVNFGLPDLTGRTASSIHVPTLEKVLRRVILDFEPRLIKNSVRVRLLKDAEKFGPNALVFGIEAELWAQPLPLRLFLRTDIDLETGDVMISEAGGESD